MHIKKFVVVFDILIIVTITNIKSSKKKKFILNIFRMSRLLSPSRHSSQQKIKYVETMQCALCVLCAKKEESKKKKISRLPTGEIKKIIASTIKEYRMRDSYQFRVFNSFMLRQTIKKRGRERRRRRKKIVSQACSGRA